MTGSYCFHCGDTGNRALAGNWLQCDCTEGVTRFEWCRRVVNHRKGQGKRMTRWVIDEWLDGRLASCFITEDEYRLIADGERPLVQLALFGD